MFYKLNSFYNNYHLSFNNAKKYLQNPVKQIEQLKSYQSHLRIMKAQHITYLSRTKFWQKWNCDNILIFFQKSNKFKLNSNIFFPPRVIATPPGELLKEAADSHDFHLDTWNNQPTQFSLSLSPLSLCLSISLSHTQSLLSFSLFLNYFEVCSKFKLPLVYWPVFANKVKKIDTGP